MKKSIFIIALSAPALTSCNEDKFLEETPLDFMSGDNSYSTAADFDAATTDLYYLTRLEFFCDGDRSLDYLYGTDLMFQGSATQSNLSTEFNSTGAVAKTHWDNLYLLVSQANTMTTTLAKSSLSDAQKTLYEAKARFFRGFAYRTLAYLYGGVPLQLEQVKSPKTDYVRDTKENVLAQAIKDVEFASEHLSDITDVRDGEISLPVAYTLLSELYLATGENQKAIDAATKVINNPALSLMK